MQHPLFTADAAQVDRTMLDDFLALDLPESYTVEYKSAADNAVLEAVATLTNTYGGLVLAGVANHPVHRDRPGEVKGVPSKDREVLVNKMATMFAPSNWTPEVLAVPVSESATSL